MSDTGILSFGAYIPRRRLRRDAIYAANAWFAPGLKPLSEGERAIANWDEDSITMAVEAARDCLTGMDRSNVSGLMLSSTTLPYADRLNAGVVKEALNLDDATAAIDTTGSLRTGVSALAAALQGGSPQLCIAADLRKARPASESELQQGDGAAAILVGKGELAARYLGHHAVTLDFVDHYRPARASFDYVWENRWIRDEGYINILAGALKQALSRFGIAGEAIDRAIIPVTARGVSQSLARLCGIRPAAVADTLSVSVGDSGAAHPLLMLVGALEKAKPGEKILVAGFGQGVDVLLFEATSAITSLPKGLGTAGHIARGQSDTNYIRFLFHRNLYDLERGMRAEMDNKQPGTALFRNRRTVLGLVGRKCPRTGTVQFPRSDISVDPDSHQRDQQQDYPLAEKAARIVTYTADSLSFSPDPPTYYGVIDFEGGGRMVAEFTDADGENIEVGRQVRMVFRVKARDELRDFTKYFWKAVPVNEGGI